MKGFTLKDSYCTVISVLTLLAIWKIVSMAIGADIILPPPESVLKDFIYAIQSDIFWDALLSTIARGVAGFTIGCILGIIVGFATGFSRVMFFLFQPIIAVIRSTPNMSIILLALIWFGSNLVPIFVSFLMVFPIICSNVMEGVKNTEFNLVEMAKIHRVKRWRIITEIYLPSILPYLVAGVSTAIGISWKVIISAEVLSQPVFGIGTQLHDARIFLETGQLFAWTVVAIIVGFTFEKLLRNLEHRLQPWRHNKNADGN